MLMVYAIGLNIFPSMPSRVKSGRKTIMIITMPKVIGLPTSFADSRILWRRPSLWCSFSERCLKIFSIITTEPSTIMPMAMANPPRDMRFADMPIHCMAINVVRAATGSVAATIRALLILPRKRKRMTTTRIPPSSRAFVIVPMQAFTSSVLS